MRTYRLLRPLTIYLQDSLIIYFLFFTQRLVPNKSYIPLKAVENRLYTYTW